MPCAVYIIPPTTLHRPVPIATPTPHPPFAPPHPTPHPQDHDSKKFSPDVKLDLAKSSTALLFTIADMFTKPCLSLFGNTTLLQTLSSGGYDAVMSYSMFGDGVDSCLCLLSHYLRVPFIKVHGLALMAGAPLGSPQVGYVYGPWFDFVTNIITLCHARPD